MLAIIGFFIGLFGVIYMAAIGKTLGVLFAFMGFYLIVKQIYVDELENELERRELGYKPRKLRRKNLTAWLDDWTEAKP